MQQLYKKMVIKKKEVILLNHLVLFAISGGASIFRDPGVWLYFHIFLLIPLCSYGQSCGHVCALEKPG